MKTSTLTTQVDPKRFALFFFYIATCNERNVVDILA